ncbi:hypothetical protein [Rhizobium sp. NXC24]|uniref:hypothetical protein n=1 Tax=Rhizobium sp. NXC24 TaxID=2048897 RepID=UPI000CDF3FF3|nr:hypothetical protein [Rhizobium sp. NXC24]AVA25571.1 hypothetical protein NXC24_PC01130 [Rhizobium sp. NXC24]
MKTLLIACALGLGALTTMAVPTHARPVAITTNDSSGYYDEGYHSGSTYHVRGDVRHHHVHCVSRTVETHHHGRLIMKQQRFCR